MFRIFLKKKKKRALTLYSFFYFLRLTKISITVCSNLTWTSTTSPAPQELFVSTYSSHHRFFSQYPKYYQEIILYPNEKGTNVYVAFSVFVDVSRSCQVYIISVQRSAPLEHLWMSCSRNAKPSPLSYAILLRHSDSVKLSESGSKSNDPTIFDGCLQYIGWGGTGILGRVGYPATRAHHSRNNEPHTAPTGPHRAFPTYRQLWREFFFFLNVQNVLIHCCDSKTGKWPKKNINIYNTGRYHRCREPRGQFIRWQNKKHFNIYCIFKNKINRFYIKNVKDI